MSIEIDLAGDFALVSDGLQTVTLQNAASPLTTTVAHALRRAVSKNEAAGSGGDVLLSDVRWHLPANETPTPPAVDDKIVDAQGTVWNIRRAQLATCGSRWNCLCRADPPLPPP